MTRYDDNIYIAGLQSLYNVGAAHVRSFIDDFGGPYELGKLLRRLKI